MAARVIDAYNEGERSNVAASTWVSISGHQNPATWILLNTMIRFAQHWLLTLGILLVIFGLTSVASACPTCKEAMAGDPVHESMVRGYFYSIIFMMSMPFLIFTALSTYFFLEVRKARRHQTLTAAQPMPTGS